MIPINQQQQIEQRQKNILKYLLMNNSDKNQYLQSKIMLYQQEEQNPFQQDMQNQFKINSNHNNQYTDQDQYEVGYIKNQIKCLYNQKQQKLPCQFLCCTKGCLKYPAICGQESCVCQKNHLKCNIIVSGKLLSKINRKIQKNPPKLFQLYIQGKIILLNYMMDRISQEKRVFQKWIRLLKKRQEQPELFYLFLNKDGNCEHLRIGIGEKEFQKHQKCKCNKIELKFRPQGRVIKFQNKAQLQREHQKEEQLSEQKYIQSLKALYNQRCKKFNQVIDIFSYKIEQVSQLEAKSYFLNYAQFQIFKYFLQTNGSILCSKSNQNQNLFNGNTIFIANQLQQLNLYNQKSFSQINDIQNLFTAAINQKSDILLLYQHHNKKQDIYYPSLKNLRNKWKSIGQKIFRTEFQGKALQYDSHYFQIWQQGFEHVRPKQSSYFSNSLQKMFNFANDQTYFIDKKMKKIKFLHNQSFQKKIKSKKNIKQIQYLGEKGKIKQIESFYRFLNKKSFDILKKISSLCLSIPNKSHFHYARCSLDNFKHKIRNNLLQKQQSIQTLIQNEQFKRNCFPYLDQMSDFCQCIQENQEFSKYFNKQQELIRPIQQQRKNFALFKDKLKNEYSYFTKINPERKKCSQKKSLCLKFISQLEKTTYIQSFSIIFKDRFPNQDKINDLIFGILQNNPKITQVKLSGYQWDTSLFDNCFVDHFRTTHLSKISKLFIQAVHTKFSIFFLRSLKNLKVLSFRNCKNQKLTQMQLNLKHLIQIQELTLAQNNSWITNQTLQGFNRLTKLKLLNLTKTSISSNGIIKLPLLKKLKTFICEYNPNIYRQDILELFKTNPQISKISVGSLYWKKGYPTHDFYFILNKISLNGLTHINFKFSFQKVPNKILDQNFKSIKFIIQ